MLTEIKLNTDIKIIKELFYSKGYHRLFYGLYNKKQSIVLLISIILLPFYLYFSIKYDNRTLLLTGLMVYVIIISQFWKATESVYLWRKKVKAFIKNVEHVKEITIKYDDNQFIHIQDGDEIKLGWSEIEKGIINDMCLWLIFKDRITLPRKSMSENEYQLLIEKVKEKVKNIIKE